MEDAGVTEKVSDGGTVAEGSTPVGVRLPGLFIRSCLICQVEDSAAKGCDGNKGSQPSQVNSSCFFIPLSKTLFSGYHRDPVPQLFQWLVICRA